MAAVHIIYCAVAKDGGVLGSFSKEGRRWSTSNCQYFFGFFPHGQSRLGHRFSLYPLWFLSLWRPPQHHYTAIYQFPLVALCYLGRRDYGKSSSKTSVFVRDSIHFHIIINVNVA